MSDPGGRVRADFCWIGHDEDEDLSGRGEALLGEDGTLAGVFWIFQGGDLAFAGEKMKVQPKKKKVKRR